MEFWEIMAKQGKYKEVLCHNIGWTIIGNGHRFFSQRLHPDDFKKGGIPSPKSLRDDVINDLPYEHNPSCLSFPDL